MVLNTVTAMWRKRLLAGFFSTLVFLSARAEEWQDALARMPLKESPALLTSSNCVQLLLNSFQPDHTVKALIFMPGATDEFYMFHRARASLTNTNPSMLDAVTALTNQTFIRATFQPPLLLLHTDEDPLDPLITIENSEAAGFLRERRFAARAVFFDRDWNYIQPILEKTLKIHVLPWRQTFESWHFYRHSFTAAGLDGLEALRATALAGKTKVTISKRPFFHLRRFQARFAPDARVRTVPTIEPARAR